MSTRHRRLGHRMGVLLCLIALLGGGSLRPPADVRAADVSRPGDIWVDPVACDDGAAGGDRASAVRTLSEAWRRLPQGTPLDRPHRIVLTAGTYSDDAMPHYLESL